jgi:hypothetical protein
MRWVVSATPRPLYPRLRPGTHRIGGWVGRCGRLRKISAPPGFDPRTVQPVASRYTDWATGPTPQRGFTSKTVLGKPGLEQWQTQEFCSAGGGGVGHQIHLRKDGRKNGDLGAVTPYSGFPLNLQTSETRVLMRLLWMYLPRNWEFGSALSELRIFRGRGV